MAYILWFVFAMVVSLVMWALFAKDLPFWLALVIGVGGGLFLAVIWRVRWRGST